jgi:hypothetical protein
MPRRLALAAAAATTLALCLPQSAEAGRQPKSHRDPHEVVLFRDSHPCPATGKTHGACPGWVVDHVKALCVGGADAPDNMQWQTRADAKAKDKWECKGVPLSMRKPDREVR